MSLINIRYYTRTSHYQRIYLACYFPNLYQILYSKIFLTGAGSSSGRWYCKTPNHTIHGVNYHNTHNCATMFLPSAELCASKYNQILY